MGKEISIDNTFLFEAEKKIHDLIMESYKAGISYGMAFAVIMQKEESKETEEALQEVLSEAEYIAMKDGRLIFPEDLIKEKAATIGSDNFLQS